MTQAQLFGAAGRTDAPETLAELEVDYTPSAVAVQLLLALNELAKLGGCPGRCLCPSAGSGVWARAMRAVFDPSMIVGVDIRASEARNLASACDVAITGDIEDPRTLQGAGDFDLVADNPYFTALNSGYWPTMLLERGLLAPEAIIALYSPSQWGQSAEAAPRLARWSPSLQIRVGGRIAHRGDGKGDAREYSLWVWLMSGGRPLTVDRRAGAVGSRPEWRTVQLPELPTAMRRWEPSCVPGTYPIDPALVTEIRARYL
jgi:hypothetical protein